MAGDLHEDDDFDPEEIELEPDGIDAVEEAPALDPEVMARRDAALSHVRQFGDPVLRSATIPVDRFDGRLREEVAHMSQIMEDSLGIGLAATQVGVLHRVLVYRVHQGAPVLALVNPAIEWSSPDTEAMEEGCLSLPGVHVDVERPIHVRVAALDVAGEPLRIEASGLEARVIQHEVDHLDGVLILDRTSREERKLAMRELREAASARAA